MGLSLPSIREDNRRWWTLGAMCFALFMIMLDNTVVNVALPSIQRDLDVSVSSLEWTVNAYTLTFAVLLVTGGRLGDIFGRRRGFLTGVVIFGLSSLFIAFSQSGEWLIVGRAVQGVGAAFMMPATLSIISNAFPAARTWPRDRHVGRDLGAGARDRPRRRRLPRRERLVAVDLPVNLRSPSVAVVVTLFATHESRDETVAAHRRLPRRRHADLGLAALILALVEGNSWGWGSPAIIGLFVFSASR